MALRRITAPAYEPITVADAKAHLRIDVADDDAYIAVLIQAAREQAESICERSFVEQTWELTLDTFPDAIRLPMPRILSVAAVQYLDDTGALRTLAPASYVVDDKSEPGYIVPAPESTWPATQAGAVNALTVTYKAGLKASPVSQAEAAAQVPACVRQWMLLAVGEMYANRERSAERPAVAHGFADHLLDDARIFGL